MYQLLGSLKQLKLKCKAVMRITANDKLTWEQKYSLIFSQNMSGLIFQLVHELGLEDHYYDPDITYEADVIAFAKYSEERLTAATELLKALFGTE